MAQWESLMVCIGDLHLSQVLFIGKSSFDALYNAYGNLRSQEIHVQSQQ